MEKQDELPPDERYRLAQGLEEHLEPTQPPPVQQKQIVCPGYCPTCPLCRERN